ncbi:MAG TPA: Crp/Fnr family transcriptional regulator [Candidatus Saccharimonadia bacterium]|nr:Crp/Fnr family transcriptional regulator [Candidatus Saccharimonadia bacterium]
MSADFSTPELPPKGIIEPLGDDDRLLLSSYGEFLPVHERQVLIEEGHQQNTLYYVISGTLHATTTRSGRPVLLGRIGAGETIGEINIFHPGLASATVTAIEFTQIWKIDRQSLEDFMNVSPLPASHLLIGIASTLSRRLRETNDKVAMMHQI